MAQRFFSITVEIAAPPEIVWRVMTDVESWPEWTASVKRIVRLTPGPLATGSRLRIHQPKLPPTQWRVTDVEAGRYFVSENIAPGVRVGAHHSIEAAGANSCVTLAIRFEGVFAGLLSRLTRNLNELYLAMEASGLREYCERQATKAELPAS